MKPTARLFLPFFLVGIFFLYGCSLPFAPASSSASPVPETEPAPTVAAPSQTPYVIINPVYRFYSEFSADTSAALSSFASALTSANTCDAMLALMDLSQYSVLLSMPRISVGRLSSDDEYTFSDTLFGAAQGSGRLKVSGDGDATFEFTYSGDAPLGTVLAGTLSDMTLTYALYDLLDTGEHIVNESGEVQEDTVKLKELRLEAEIQKAGDGWMTCVNSEILSGTLEIGGRVRFSLSAQRPSSLSSTSAPQPIASGPMIEFDGQTLTFPHSASSATEGQ